VRLNRSATVNLFCLAAACLVAPAVLGYLLSVPALCRESTKSVVQKLAKTRLRQAELRLNGASCLACLRQIERELRHTDGVLQVEMAFKPPAVADVVYDASTIKLRALTGPLEKRGYFIEVLSDRAIAKIPPMKEASASKTLEVEAGSAVPVRPEAPPPPNP